MDQKTVLNSINQITLVKNQQDDKEFVNNQKLRTNLIAIKFKNNRANTNLFIIFVLLALFCAGLFVLCIFIWPSMGTGNEILSFKMGWELQSYKIPVVIDAAIGLSMGGYIVQQVTQNRLADTSILGISTVNIVLLVIVFTCGVGTTLIFQNIEPWMLLLLSVLTSLLIFFMSYKKNSNVSTKFVLAGIIVNFLFIGFGNTFMNGAKANEPIFLVQPYINGQLPLPSLSNYDLYCSIAMMLFATLWVLVIAKQFYISNSNFLVAKSIGVKPTAIYFQAIVIAAIYAASAFIVVGNITFLGIATGNIAFFIFKKRPVSGAFGSILAGISFMLFSFFIGNNCVANSFIPSSMIIPLIVAPIFAFLAIWKK